MRKKIIAGNWKMNKTPREAAEFAAKLKNKVKNSGHDVVFCVPAVCILPVADILMGTDVAVGAQNMHWEDSGAFTGEISAKMLKDAGASYVVIGHSERREYFGETDAGVNKKAVKAIAEGLTPIICVGETLEQRWENRTIGLVRRQVGVAYKGVSAGDAQKTVVAYEPIWAIGTGVTATSAQAEEVCAAIRAMLCELYGDPVSQQIRIQYGGSVSEKNASELFRMPNIDGGLVGGASLKMDFEKIVFF